MYGGAAVPASAAGPPVDAYADQRYALARHETET